MGIPLRPDADLIPRQKIFDMANCIKHMMELHPPYRAVPRHTNGCETLPTLPERSDKQQHFRSPVHLPQTGRGRCRSRALGLQVLEPLADGVIVVHRGRREVLPGLGEG